MARNHVEQEDSIANTQREINPFPEPKLRVDQDIRFPELEGSNTDNRDFHATIKHLLELMREFLVSYAFRETDNIFMSFKKNDKSNV